MATYYHLSTDDFQTMPANGGTMVGRSLANPEIRVLDADGTTYHWGTSTTFHELNRAPSAAIADNPVNGNQAITFPAGSIVTMSEKANVYIGIRSI